MRQRWLLLWSINESVGFGFLSNQPPECQTCLECAGGHWQLYDLCLPSLKQHCKNLYFVFLTCSYSLTCTVTNFCASVHALVTEMLACQLPYEFYSLEIVQSMGLVWFCLLPVSAENQSGYID